MKLFAVLLAASLCGCVSLNGPTTPNHNCSEMKKCCGCEGMENCGKNPDGTTCCKADDCKCKQVTQK